MSGGARAGGSVLTLMLPERSAVNAVFSLSRRLLERGHRVIHGCSPEMEGHVVRQGFDCRVFDFYGTIGFAEARDRVSGLSRIRRAGPEARLWSEIYRNALAQIREWIALCRPDVVLLDQLMWPYAVPFLEAGVTVLGLTATFASVRNRFSPPVFSGIVPSTRSTAWQQIVNLSSWAWLEVSRVVARIRHWLLFSVSDDRWGWRDLDPEQVTGRYGVGFRRGEYGLRLNVPELVLAPSELDFPGAIRANPRYYAGSCVDTRREDVAFQWHRIDPRRALIYCSLGTYSHRYPNAERLFRAAVEAARLKREWQMVIQTGAARWDGPLQSIPENVIIASEVPQLKLLERATACITHGGLSSVREAIFYGVPLLVFPCWYDQSGNAARVSYHHLGMKGDIQRITGSRLLRMMERVLGEEAYLLSVKRMQRTFRQHAECQPGVDLIETFLPGSSSPSSLQTQERL